MREIKTTNENQIANRKYWVNEISKLSGDFGGDSERVEQELSEEIRNEGINSLIGHLRLCGAIPERYKHDSSEEKLYSKYTDVVIAKAYEAIGLTSLVLTERADAADVECVANDYSFVADAKAFRLSRTAKNQKDFKVEAMDGWKRGKPYAMVVCPIYQLPSKTSQIYQQAANRSVCVFSYTHLAVSVRYASVVSGKKAIELLHDVFKTVEALNPSKDSMAYWQAVNRRMIGIDDAVRQIWSGEKAASSESIALAREEALTYFASERERYMRLSRRSSKQVKLKVKKGPCSPYQIKGFWKLSRSKDIEWAKNKAHACDSVEAIKEIPNESAHLILSDIPYGIGAEEWDVLHENTNSAYLGTSPAQQKAGAVFKKRGKPINGWSEADRLIPTQYYEWCSLWAGDWLRILKPGGSAIVFAGRRLSHRCVAALEDAGFSYKVTLAWMRERAPHRAQRVSVVFDRRGDTESSDEWLGWRVGNLKPTFEPILWFAKPYKIGTTIADNILSHGVGAYNEAAFLKYGEAPENVLKCKFAPKEWGLHPTQKPVSLMQALIELTTIEGHLILDPFCGSGSTLVAAKNLNREFLGFDISSEFINIANQRLTSELQLFAATESLLDDHTKEKGS